MHGAGGSLEFDFDFSYLKTVHFLKLSSYALYNNTSPDLTFTNYEY